MRIVRQAEQLGIDKEALIPGLRIIQDRESRVVAVDAGYDPADTYYYNYPGQLIWEDDGVIAMVHVQDEFKRQGVATALLEFARTIRPDIRHSEDLSDAGSGWASAVS